MLFRKIVNNELVLSREGFANYIDRHRSEIDFYASALSRLQSMPAERIVACLTETENAGAFPSDELALNGSFHFAFGIKWQNHEQARQWAAEILDNRTTFAADGSQIYAAKSTTLPIAAVQIGWFENPHDGAADFEKNVEFEVLSPDVLFRDQDEPMNPDIRVEQRRYLGEVRKIGEFLDKKNGWRERGERMPVAFFDNPLLVPFSQKGLQKSFLEATIDLVKRSRDAEVPLVGYVDRSFSRDIMTMLENFEPLAASSETSLCDAILLNGRNAAGKRLLENWGDRSCFCFSGRRGLEAFRDPATDKSAVGFTYLRTASDSPPSRLDIPSWVYDSGLLEEVLDVVRAECVVGLGYPYALESADQTALISVRDREIFFRALQEFATRETLDFSVARKDASKTRRR